MQLYNSVKKSLFKCQSTFKRRYSKNSVLPDFSVDNPYVNEEFIFNDPEPPQPSRFDWMKALGEADTLPELPDEATYKKEEDWWRILGKEDLIPNVESTMDFKAPFDHTDVEVKEEELPFNLLNEYPLPQTHLPTNMPLQQAKLRKRKLLENFELYTKIPKPSVVLTGFLTMRREGFIPHREYYCLLIPCLLCYCDFTAIQILLDEMKTLGYALDDKVHSALITEAIIKQDRVLLEQRWNAMLEDKYEPTAQVASQRILYYSRYAEDHDFAFKCFKESVSLGHKDPLVGSVILTMCRDNNLFSLADEIIKILNEEGFIKSKFTTEIEVFEVEGQKYVHNTYAVATISLYEVIADITARQDRYEETVNYIAKAEKIFEKHVRKEDDDPYLPNLLTLEQVIACYFRKGHYVKGLTMMSAFEKIGTRFPFEFYKNVMISLSKQNNTHHFKELQLEFETWGHQYDGELYSAILRMYSRVKDYRKVKNTWDEMVMAGCRPDSDCYTILLDTYEKVGFPEDAQRFYEFQLRTPIKFNRGFHEVMFHNYLKRDYPASARILANSRMKDDGHNLTQEEVVLLIKKFCELGGGNQAMSVVDNEYAELGLTLDAELLASIIKAFTINMGPSSTEEARRVWEKYSNQVILNYETAETLIRAFGTLRESNIAIQIYNRIRREYTFTEKDSISLFAAVLEVPKVTTVPITDRLEVMKHIREYGIQESLELTLAALKLAANYASAKTAVNIMKQFVIDYNGMPFHRGLFIDFLTILVRFDSGEARGQAMVWLKRIIPVEQHPTFIDSLRFPDRYSLDDIRESFMSLIQSSALVNFVDSIDLEKVTPVPLEEDYKEVFEGSDLDIEDLLVAKYGLDQRANIQKAIGADPEYLATKAKLEQLHEERKRAYAAYNEGRDEKGNIERTMLGTGEIIKLNSEEDNTKEMVQKFHLQDSEELGSYGSGRGEEEEGEDDGKGYVNEDYAFENLLQKRPELDSTIYKNLRDAEKVARSKMDLFSEQRNNNPKE